MTAHVATALAVLLAALTAGCANDSQIAAPGNAPTAQREYRTGSNIPVREPRSTSSEEKDRTATPADAARPAPAPAKPTN